jgi:hypothetical protein
MSKFGVGVGDDFPVDDGRGNEPGHDQAGPQDDRAEYEEWKRRRDAHRAQRDEWRRQREEWRDRKRAFKERVRAAARESFGPRDGDYEYERHYGWRSGRSRRGGFPFLVWPAIGLLIPILIIALVVSVIAAVFKSPFLFLGLIALGFLFFGWRHHHHHDDFRGHDYDFDLRPAGGPRSPQPPQPTVVVTPPPSAPSGK